MQVLVLTVVLFLFSYGSVSAMQNAGANMSVPGNIANLGHSCGHQGKVLFYAKDPVYSFACVHVRGVPHICAAMQIVRPHAMRMRGTHSCFAGHAERARLTDEEASLIAADHTYLNTLFQDGVETVNGVPHAIKTLYVLVEHMPNDLRTSPIISLYNAYRFESYALLRLAYDQDIPVFLIEGDAPTLAVAIDLIYKKHKSRLETTVHEHDWLNQFRHKKGDGQVLPILDDEEQLAHMCGSSAVSLVQKELALVGVPESTWKCLIS